MSSGNWREAKRNCISINGVSEEGLHINETDLISIYTNITK